MKVARRDIARAVAAQIDEGRSAPELASSLAMYLVRERRVRDLDGILRDVARLRALHHGIVEARVTTAEPLTEALASQVRDLVATYGGGTRTVIVANAVDPSIVGGVKVQTDEYELDASVRSKLNKLKHVSSLKGSN